MSSAPDARSAGAELESNSLSVHQAIAAVINAMPAVGKDGEMLDGPRYRYRTIEAIKAGLKPLLGRHGVHYAPHHLVSVVDDTVPVGSRGAVWQRTRLVVLWRVFGPAGGYIEVQTRGEGVDSSDKGSNKAMTAAEKQMLLTVFAIADGTDDPDHDRPEIDAGPETLLRPQERPESADHQAASNARTATRSDLLARVHELRDAMTPTERGETKAWLAQAGIASVNRAKVAELVELVEHLEHVISSREAEA